MRIETNHVPVRGLTVRSLDFHDPHRYPCLSHRALTSHPIRSKFKERTGQASEKFSFSIEMARSLQLVCLHCPCLHITNDTLSDRKITKSKEMLSHDSNPYRTLLLKALQFIPLRSSPTQFSRSLWVQSSWIRTKTVPCSHSHGFAFV
jgi:hypothetical protein